MKNLKARRLNLKNKLFTKRRFVNNGFARRKYLTKIGRSNYSFPISLSPTIWRDPTYDNQNLNIQVTELIQQNPLFINLSNMYQYWKIDAVSLKAIPQPIEGTYPPSGWAYLLGNNNMTINYASIPRLPGAKLIPSNKTTTHYFRRVGRQYDFNWYNEGPNPNSNFDIRIRFSEAPNRAAFILQVKVFLTFSMLIDASSNKEKVLEDCNYFISNYDQEKNSLLDVEENKQLDVVEEVKKEAVLLDVPKEEKIESKEDLKEEATTEIKITKEHINFRADVINLYNLSLKYVPKLSYMFDNPDVTVGSLKNLLSGYTKLILQAVQTAKRDNPDGAGQFYRYYLEFKKLYFE
jgi:hypothetical protein